MQAFKRIGQPADVGPEVAFLAFDAVRWITDDTIRVDGGSKLQAAFRNLTRRVPAEGAEVASVRTRCSFRTLLFRESADRLKKATGALPHRRSRRVTRLPGDKTSR